jgi:hypothetical protein
MLAGSLGVGLAADLGVGTVRAEEESGGRITFGEMEPLVALMQETPLKRLQRVLVEKIREGADLRTLVAAGTLANARTFGGRDYVGYHTFMALAPALDMAGRLPAELKPLPVLKVLYRNTKQIHSVGGVKSEALKKVAESTGRASGTHEENVGLALREATRAGRQDEAERILVGMKGQPRGEMFNHVQYAVQDSANVHRVVLAWRAWLAVDLVGEEHATTLLRQSVRFCTGSSRHRIKKRQREPELWTALPKLLDQYKLLGKPLGNRKAEDQWVEKLAAEIFTGNSSTARDAVAQALAEGFELESVSEAISLAANLQLLHDPGRPTALRGGKYKGSVHGDSVGVHASDAANAWRNIARVSNHRNAVISLLLGAHNSAGMRERMTHEWWPLKHEEVDHLDKPGKVLAILDEAVRAQDQALAGAAVARYHELGRNAKPIFDLLLRFATSEDGALHAEKYYRTVTEEFATTRPAFRWRQLIALARVSASEYGTKAPGHHEACDLLNVKV